MDVFKLILSVWLSLISAIILEYILKFRPGLAEKFVLKSDCIRNHEQLQQIHTENREDHKEIFNKLDDIKNVMIETLKNK